MNENIISDGVSRITSANTAGYGAGFGMGLNNVIDTSNAWRGDSHGFERTIDLIQDIATVSVAVEKNGAANEIATEKNGAANQLATEKTSAATQLANSLLFANTQNLLISGFKDGRYDAAVNAAATALAAAVNTAAVQASIAACCCEMQKAIDDSEDKVLDDGQKTRDLINFLKTADNAVLLGIANAELIAHALPPVV